MWVKLGPKPLAALAAAGMLAAIAACDRMRAGSASGLPAGDAKASASQVKELLSEYRGKVLLLMLGREDCPGTIRSQAILDAYALRKPADVVVLRVEVPLPGERLTVGPWSHPYPRRLDDVRRLADELEFFYYPTLYVFDRDGELRFTGGCDPERTEAMAKEILAEAPGQPSKKMYSLMLPPVGTQAPAFSGETVAGQPATLASVRGERGTLLVFTRTSCPYSRQALSAIRAMAEARRKDGIAVVLVNQWESRADIAPLYAKQAPGLPVIWDPSGEICKSYGVDSVPFFFLLKADGTIAQRRSFTPPAATGAVNSLLGIAAPAPRYPVLAAG
jgi:peroxiredoxin